MRISRDVIAKYGEVKPGTPTYRESTVRKAERVKFWTHLGGVTVLGGLGWVFYLWVPGLALGVGFGLGGCLAAWMGIVGLMRLSRSYNRSKNIIAHVREVGVAQDE